MSASTKLVDKLEVVENFRAWKYKIGLILEENDLAKFIKENVPEFEENAAKEKYKKDMIKAKRIIAHPLKTTRSLKCLLRILQKICLMP
jgi:glutaredoxin 2